MKKRIPVEDRTYYYTDEVEELTGVSQTTLRAGAKDGDPGALSLGPLNVRETWTWSRKAVDRWVAGERKAS